MKIIKTDSWYGKETCLVISNAIEVETLYDHHPDGTSGVEQILVQMIPTSYSIGKFIVDMSFEQFVNFVKEPHETVYETKFKSTHR